MWPSVRWTVQATVSAIVDNASVTLDSPVSTAALVRSVPITVAAVVCASTVSASAIWAGTATTAPPECYVRGTAATRVPVWMACAYVPRAFETVTAPAWCPVQATVTTGARALLRNVFVIPVMVA